MMNRGNTWCMRFRDWPYQDLAAWERAITPGGWLEDGGLGCHLRPKSQAKYQEGYGHWLAFLSDQEWLDPAVTPAERITASRLTAYAAWMTTRVAPETVRCRLEDLRRALTTMGEEIDSGPFTKLLARLPRGPSRDRRLQIREPAELFQLGLKLMARAEEGALGPPRHNGVAFRDGLMIALTARRPLRRGNLASLTLDGHLVRSEDRVSIVVPGNQMKAGAPIRLSWPASLETPLMRYLSHWREILLGRHPENQALWISSRGGRPLKAHTIACNFRRYTGREFDVAISPHLFRHAAGTMMSVHDAANVRAVAGVLGHKSYSTSEQYYILARSLEAIQRYNEAFDLMLGEAT